MVKIIYTDGSCRQTKPPKGGWAYVVLENHQKIAEASGPVDKPTNNRGELMAIIKALENTTGEVVIYSDSEYCVKTLTEWVWQWQKRGWRKANGKPPLNVDLIQRILQLQANRSVTYQHVYGHAGNHWNEYIDKMARQAAV